MSSKVEAEFKDIFNCRIIDSSVERAKPAVHVGVLQALDTIRDELMQLLPENARSIVTSLIDGDDDNDDGEKDKESTVADATSRSVVLAKKQHHGHLQIFDPIRRKIEEILASLTAAVKQVVESATSNLGDMVTDAMIVAVKAALRRWDEHHQKRIARGSDTSSSPSSSDEEPEKAAQDIEVVAVVAPESTSREIPATPSAADAPSESGLWHKTLESTSKMVGQTASGLLAALSEGEPTGDDLDRVLGLPSAQDESHPSTATAVESELVVQAVLVQGVVPSDALPFVVKKHGIYCRFRSYVCCRRALTEDGTNPRELVLVITPRLVPDGNDADVEDNIIPKPVRKSASQRSGGDDLDDKMDKLRDRIGAKADSAAEKLDIFKGDADKQLVKFIDRLDVVEWASRQACRIIKRTMVFVTLEVQRFMVVVSAGLANLISSNLIKLMNRVMDEARKAGGMFGRLVGTLQESRKIGVFKMIATSFEEKASQLVHLAMTRLQVMVLALTEDKLRLTFDKLPGVKVTSEQFKTIVGDVSV